MEDHWKKCVHEMLTKGNNWCCTLGLFQANETNYSNELKNLNWQEADQLPMYKRRGAEAGTIWNK